MKKYRVVVNGAEYEVGVEEIKDGAAAVATATAAPAAPAAAPVGGEQIKAPMTGTILSVNVSNGAKVRKGDVLFILEALKMENEIMSPCDGTVSSVNVQKGASVENGTLLCVLG